MKRKALALAAVACALAMLAGSACITDDEPDGPGFTIQTFTPTPPNYTPEALLTRVAERTARAQTATALPSGGIPTPGAVGTPRPRFTPSADAELRPPDLYLTTNGGEAVAAIGSFHWCSITTGNCADIQTGYIVLETDTIIWTAGTPGVIEIFPVTIEPETVEVSFYVMDNNAVIPTDASGQVIGDSLAFVAREEPLQQETFTSTDISVAPTVPPGRYIVSVSVDWLKPENAPFPLHTQYAFVVDVF